MVVKDEQRKAENQERSKLNTGCKDSDTGLEISNDCLLCPLSACKYDEQAPLIKWREAHRLKGEVVIQQYSRSEVQALAAESNVTERTIWRRIKRNRSHPQYQLTLSFALDLPDSDPDE